ncbi:hypothetical protein KM043_013964 [Ampulex compressa]|nr:hypothetical protein KM043_013964 [Ampulex compressa]
MATLEQLIETQKFFSHHIRRIWVKYEKMAQPRRTVSAVQNRITILENLWDECQDLHKSIIAASDSKSSKDQAYFVEDIFSSIVEAVDKIRDYLAEEFQKQMAPSAATDPAFASAPISAATSVSEAKVALQLPPINLRRFTRDLTSWMAVRDMFLSLVDSRTDLFPVQKLYYLKLIWREKPLRCWPAWSYVRRTIPRHQPRPGFATRERPGLGHTDRVSEYFPSDQPVGGSIHLPHPGEIGRCHVTGLGSRAEGFECVPYAATPEPKRGFVRAHQASSHTPLCLLCHQEHPLFRCPAFLEGTCPSGQTCRQCKQKHHTLLHLERNLLNISTSPVAPATILVSQSATSNVLPEGEWMRSVLVLVTGIGDSCAGVARHSAAFSVEPCRCSQPVIPMTALVRSNLTGYVPPCPSVDTLPNFLSSLPLADIDFHRSEPIQLIIGADFFEQILLDGVIHSSLGSSLAQRTIFGWVLSGNYRVPASNQASILQSSVVHSNHVVVVDSLQKTLRNFWELEEVPQRCSFSPEEDQCESHFQNTHFRLPDRRYIVRLPVKFDAPPSIGDTSRMA